MLMSADHGLKLDERSWVPLPCPTVLAEHVASAWQLTYVAAVADVVAAGQLGDTDAVDAVQLCDTDAVAAEQPGDTDVWRVLRLLRRTPR